MLSRQINYLLGLPVSPLSNNETSIQRSANWPCWPEQNATEGRHRPDRHDAYQADDQCIFDDSDPVLIVGEATQERVLELALGHGLAAGAQC